MSDEPKPDLAGYAVWVAEKLQGDFGRMFKLCYNTNVQNIESAAKSHPFFVNFDVRLQDLAKEYRNEFGARLLAQDGVGLELQRKPYDSVVEKTFRQNILRNKNYPAAPDGGWVTPDTVYYHLNDILRATIVCSYVDALPWLAEKLKEEALREGLELEFNPEDREEGYYAYHLYAHLPPVPLENISDSASPNPDRGKLRVEVQLTTQLQNALREVTHFHYERRRLNALPKDWKWKHESDQFRASYISHALHLIDGLIAQLRTQAADARHGTPTTADPLLPISPEHAP